MEPEETPVEGEVKTASRLNNLYVSFSLAGGGEELAALISRLKFLGQCAPIHPGLWFLQSRYSAEDALIHAWMVMNAESSLFVVECRTAPSLAHANSDSQGIELSDRAWLQAAARVSGSH